MNYCPFYFFVPGIKDQTIKDGSTAQTMRAYKEALGTSVQSFCFVVNRKASYWRWSLEIARPEKWEA